MVRLSTWSAGTQLLARWPSSETPGTSASWLQTGIRCPMSGDGLRLAYLYERSRKKSPKTSSVIFEMVWEVKNPLGRL